MEQYKYIVFFAGLLLTVPIAAMIRGNSAARKFLMGSIVVLSSFIYFLDINFLSMETYHGTVRGFEVTIVDLVVLILFLATCLDANIKKRVVVPGFWVNIIYIICALFSLWFSNRGAYSIYGYFAIFQYVRALMLYWTFYHLIRDESDYRLLIQALCAVILLNAGVALYDRYILNYHRIRGLTGHPNLLGAYSNMLGIVPLYLLLKKPSGQKPVMLLVGALSMMVTTALSISKGAIAALAAGLALVLGSTFSLRRNVVFSAIMIIMISVVWFKASDSIMDRVDNPNLNGEELRREMNEAAMILADENVFGGGYNNFSHSTQDLFAADVAPAHSVYYLTLAEMGYIGLFAFGLVWARFLSIGLMQFFVKRESVITVVAQGITIALVVLMIHSTLEDLPRRTMVMYLYAIYWAYLTKGASLSGNDKK